MGYENRGKGWYSNLRGHEIGKPLLRNPIIGSKEVSIQEYRDFIERSYKTQTH